MTGSIPDAQEKGSSVTMRLQLLFDCHDLLIYITFRIKLIYRHIIYLLMVNTVIFVLTFKQCCSDGSCVPSGLIVEEV